MEWSEDAVKFIDDLMGVMESLPKPNIRNDTQPIGPEDIEEGRFYCVHQRNGAVLMLCLSPAYINRYGNWVVKMVDYLFHHGVEVDLAEVGVVPYRDGTYNRHCWLEASNDKYMPELVARIRKAMFWED